MVATLTAAEIAALPADRAGSRRAVRRVVAVELSAVTFFEQLIPGADIDALLAVLAITSPEVAEMVGDPSHVPGGAWAIGEGAGWVMPLFTRRTVTPTRFTPGTFGVFYAAWDDATAIAEVAHHTARWLRATAEPPQRVERRMLTADIAGFAAVLTGLPAALRDGVYDPDSYAVSQRVGAHLRTRGSEAIVYRSVRHRGGVCAAVLQPRIVRDCRVIARITYLWDGSTLAAGAPLPP